MFCGYKCELTWIELNWRTQVSWPGIKPTLCCRQHQSLDTRPLNLDTPSIYEAWNQKPVYLLHFIYSEYCWILQSCVESGVLLTLVQDGWSSQFNRGILEQLLSQEVPIADVIRLIDGLPWRKKNGGENMTLGVKKQTNKQGIDALKYTFVTMP